MTASVDRAHLALVAAPEAAIPRAAGGLLAEPAARGVRSVALARLADAGRGYDLLMAGHPDGLHDLRVALRRLRSLLRAYEPLVADTVKKKTRRALRDLARATGEARDAEVALAWIAAQTDVPARARSGMRDVQRRFADDCDAAIKSVRTRLKREFPDLASRLASQLSLHDDVPALVPPAVAETFDAAASAVIARQKTRLARALVRVKSVSDVEPAHRARIAAKRLRYVLEPLHEIPNAFLPLERLVTLQDALGTARDAHQMMRRCVREVGELAARDARLRAFVAIGVKHTGRAHAAYIRLRPALLELARRARVDERRAFADFRRSWGKQQAATTLAQIP